MKKILLLIAVVVNLLTIANAQVKGNMGAYATISGVSLVSGTTYNFTITGFVGNLRPRGEDAYITTDVSVGDVIWTSDCNKFVIASITSNTGITMVGTMTNTDAAQSAPINGSRIAVLREITTNNFTTYSLPPAGDGNSGAIAGITTNVAACIQAHYRRQDSIAFANAGGGTAIDTASRYKVVTRKFTDSTYINQSDKGLAITSNSSGNKLGLSFPTLDFVSGSVADNDILPIYDASGTAHGKIRADSLRSYIGGGGGSTTLPQNRIAVGSTLNTVTSDSALVFEKWKGIETNLTSTKQRLTIGDTLYPSGSQIIFYGNSITQSSVLQDGIPVSKTFSYPSFVAANLNATEINKGIGGTGLYGSTCADSNMLCRYIIPYTPSTRYIMYMYGPQNGSSDPTIDVPTYNTKLNALIDSTIAKGYPQNRIVILGWILTGRNNSMVDTSVNYRLDTLQQGVASRRGVRFVSTYNYMKINGGLSLVSSDSLHPTAAGQSVIAQAILIGLGHKYSTGDFRVIGNEDIKGNSVVGGSQTVGGNGSFGNSVSITSGGNKAAINIRATGAGFPVYSEIKQYGDLSTDTFSLRYTTGNGYVNNYGLYHNGVATIFNHNNNNITIGGTTDYGVKLGVNGSILVNGDANFFPTSNNHGVFNFRNPVFAGNSWIEQKWYGVTSTDTFRNRYGLNGSGDAYYGLFGTASTPLIQTWANGNTTLGFTTDVAQKLAVNGSGRFDGNLLIQPTTATSSTIKVRIPTFSVGNYVEQQFYVNAAGDTVSLRHSIISGGDRLFGIYDDNVAQFVYNATSNNFGIGKGASSTPQYRLDIDAITGSAGDPLRLRGLQAGATSDSIVTSASGVLRRMDISTTVESTHKAFMKAFAAASSVDAGVADVGWDALTNTQLTTFKRLTVFANGLLHPIYHGTSAPSAGTYNGLGYWVNGTVVNFVDASGNALSTVTNVRIDYR